MSFCRYSPLCDRDASAYNAYVAGVSVVSLARLWEAKEGAPVGIVQAVQEIFRGCGAGVGDEFVAVGSGGSVRDGLRSAVRAECDRTDSVWERGFGEVDGGGFVETVVGVDCVGSEGDEGIKSKSLDSVECGFDGMASREFVRRSGGEAQVGARGPHYERNKKNREEQKKRKAKRKMMNQDWRKHEKGFSGGSQSVEMERESVRSVGEGQRKVQSWKMGVQHDGETGFWNSCSLDVRQQLIDSKARMHIAENERREREAKSKIQAMDSPVAMVQEVLRIVKLTEECAKRANDNQVAGWARTVAQSQSEALSRSAPTTLQSFDSFVESSTSSVPIDVHDGVLQQFLAEQKKNDELLKQTSEMKKEIDEFKKKQQQVEVVVPKVLVKPVVPVMHAGGLPKSVLREQYECEIRRVERRFIGKGSYDPMDLLYAKQAVTSMPRFGALFYSNK